MALPITHGRLALSDGVDLEATEPTVDVHQLVRKILQQAIEDGLAIASKADPDDRACEDLSDPQEFTDEELDGCMALLTRVLARLPVSVEVRRA